MKNHQPHKFYRLNIMAFLISYQLLTNTATAAESNIAIFSGPTATIQNNKPLITSNKAREQYGLPLLKDPWGKVTMDWPRYQRLAAPVTVYIEMFTAHPLEADVAELYEPPGPGSANWYHPANVYGAVNTEEMFSYIQTIFDC